MSDYEDIASYDVYTGVNFYFWTALLHAVYLGEEKQTTKMKKLLIALICASALPVTLRGDDDIVREIDIKKLFKFIYN